MILLLYIHKYCLQDNLQKEKVKSKQEKYNEVY